jgi:hypothetical protein
MATATKYAEKIMLQYDQDIVARSDSKSMAEKREKLIDACTEWLFENATEKPTSFSFANEKIYADTLFLLERRVDIKLINQIDRIVGDDPKEIEKFFNELTVRLNREKDSDNSTGFCAQFVWGCCIRFRYKSYPIVMIKNTALQTMIDQSMIDRQKTTD